MKPAEDSIVDIGLPGARDPAEPARVGFKASNLARMARSGLPVPEAFALCTTWCHDWLARPQATAERLLPGVAEHVRRLEKASGLTFGGARRPLLLSVRSGAPVSMPGMMETLLNIGLNDQSARGLLRGTGNPRLVWDSYRRLIHQYAEVVRGLDGEPFRARAAQACARATADRLQELDFRSLAALTADYLAIFRDLADEPFPADPQRQLVEAIGAVFASWRSPRAAEYRRLHGIDEQIGTAVTVQRMVFGNAGGTSGSGVGFTRDPSSGENRLYLDFLFNSQGEDVVSGRHLAGDSPGLAAALPGLARELEGLKTTLEREFGDVQEFEFTIQEETLYLLQTRAGKQTPLARLRTAVELVREGVLDTQGGLARLAGIDLGRIEQRRVIAPEEAQRLAEAVSAGIGVAHGLLALDEAALRRFAAADQPAILAREDAATEDIGAIAAAAGLLTSRGGRTSHAAVVARQLGKVCLVGCRAMRVDPVERCAWFGERRVAEGEWVCLDANAGWVYAGRTETVTERPTEYLAEVARWRGER
jgi:pyruvate,orthophosphate dikinase